MRRALTVTEVTPTARVTLSTGSPSCLRVAWDLPYGGGGPPLQPVPGSPGVYSGPITPVRAGSPAGVHHPWFAACDGPAEIPSETTAAAGIGGLTVTGTSDTTAPRVEAISVGSSSVDVTRGDVAVPVSITLADDVAGIETSYPLTLTLTPTPVTPDQALGRAGFELSVPLKQVSGTVRRGVWSGSLTLPGGSGTAWRFSLPNLQDRVGNTLPYTPEALAARGLPSQVVTRTTLAPPTPTGVSATSSVNLTGYHTVAITGPASPAGQPAATTWLVTSPGGACGPSTQGHPGETYVHGARKNGWTYCTYTVRAANAAGRSTGTVRVSAFM